MPLFEITDSGLEAKEVARFAALGLRERQDLQRLIRDEISVVDDDLLVISEEFGNWQDARRRVDLLAIDRDAHLVVIELKRTEDGGHMELQALRYAAMVSAMTFEDVVATFEAFLTRIDAESDRGAEERLSDFLGYAEGEQPEISEDVRIFLISADFGREITTCVLWLNRLEGIDIRCIRLVPYSVGEKVMLDIQQIVPLPEAADYQVQVRRKSQERERARTDGRDFTRFSVVVDGTVLPDENKRNAVRTMVSKLIERGADPESMSAILGSRFLWVEGEGVSSDQVSERLELNPPRWFLDELFSSGGKTWVLSKRWGKPTEATLGALRDAFPEAGVDFQRADSD